MAEEIVNVGYLRDPETKEIFLPQTDESLVTGLTNKIDTAINNKINSLDGNATTTDTGTGANVITEVSETDGILSSKQKTITEGSKIDVTGASGSITIAHESITTTPTDNSIDPPDGLGDGERESYVITDVTTDGYGHITAYTKDKSTNLIAADIKAPVKVKDNSMWNFRQTGGSISIGEDTARFTALKGKTLAWNQLCAPTTFSSLGGDAGWGNATLTKNNDGSYAVVISQQLTVRCWFAWYPLLNGHKCFWKTNPSLNVPSTIFSTFNNVNQFTGIVGSNASGTTSYYIFFAPGTPAGTYTFKPELIDLTLMFGAGNEPSTVAEFEALFPAPYYSYNEGTLLSITANGIKSVGFNQWDEEWEVGVISADSGEPMSVVFSAIRSKNYCKCIGGNVYYFRIPPSSGSSNNRIFWYDANKVYISNNYAPSNTVLTATAPDNAAYFKIGTHTNYGTTYNHDICINLSDTNRNGQYEPYKRNVLDLHLDNIQVKSHNLWDEEWENGDLNSSTGAETIDNTRYRSGFIPLVEGNKYYYKAPTSSIYARHYFYDANKNFISYYGTSTYLNNIIGNPSNAAYMRFVISKSDYGTTYNNDICINVSSSFNGRYEPHGILTIEGGLKGAGSVYDEIVGNKYIQRVGSVDLGEVTGGYLEVGKLLIGISDMKADYHAGLICSHYKTDSIANQKDKSVASRAGGGIAIYDSSCSTLEQYLSALDNVKANYELATPIEYELAEPIPNTYAVDDNGTEMLIPTGVDVNGVPLSAPFVGEFEYMSNFKEGVLDLMNRLNNFTPTTEIIPDSATANNTLPTSQAVIDYMRAGGNGVKPVYESGDEVTPTTDVHAGLKTEVGNNSYEYYKVPFSAVTNDPSTGTSQVQIVLNGNFS